MEWVFIIPGMILMLVAFVCTIIIIVKMFQNNQTGMGIGTIVGLFVCGIGYIVALIFGWKNKDAWGLQKVMPIFTGSLILGLVLYGIGYAILIPKLVNQSQQMQQMQQENGMPYFGNIPGDPSFPAPQP
ncbi:MAG: hypothetical protein SGI77_17885 [Pirellulaceae bacterium]|nr:hypothetical protein [Pirellulaceae bacterium]